MDDRFNFKFVISQDGNISISKAFSIEELIESCSNDDIYDSNNICDCSLSEGNPSCEGDCVPDYKEEKIKGGTIGFA